ncbi:uncharacterized protein LOC131167125 [Malania oleifera]|uniref:uncharacterized protein LOC131167125 n=1 Tax=Malania oleifera TaxID=397392 RepID=UPI0025ADBAD4|nr:uncharacterized protein LOC131167125 [Malania oleifera]
MMHNSKYRCRQRVQQRQRNILAISNLHRPMQEHVSHYNIRRQLYLRHDGLDEAGNVGAAIHLRRQDIGYGAEPHVRWPWRWRRRLPLRDGEAADPLLLPLPCLYFQVYVHVSYDNGNQ